MPSNNLELCHTMLTWLKGTDLQKPDWSVQEWAQFQIATSVHGVAPRLWQKLTAVAWVPAPQKEWLAEQYEFNQQRIAAFHTDLQAILALFSRHHVPVMLLKGSCLTTCHLADPALRPMADLDLLVQPEAFQQAQQRLNQLGYEVDAANWKHAELSHPQNREVVYWHGEHPDNPRTIDLHQACREMFSGPTVDLTDQLWDTAVSHNVVGETAVIPSPGMLWLHLVVHTSNHIWGGKNRLVNLLDIVELSQQLTSTDLFNLLHSVEARFTYPALALANRYFPSQMSHIPVEMLASQLSSRMRRFADECNLVNTSHLRQRPLRPYPKNLLTLYTGPQDVGQAVQFLLFPSVYERPSNGQTKAQWTTHLRKTGRLIHDLLRL